MDKTVTLILTENCNLNCIYCYEHYKNKGIQVMSFETAKDLIKKEIDALQTDEHIILDLFGGEPFLNFDLIKQIYDYIKNEFKYKDIRYSITTNGTLIHGDIQRWLLDRKNDIRVTLSIDGTQYMQGINRPKINGENSFQDIDLDFFVNTWDKCIAKMTISEQTLPYLAEGIKFLENAGFYCNATYAVGPVWKKENEDTLVNQLAELVSYYINNDIEDEKICSLLQYDFRLLFEAHKKSDHWCGVGMDNPCYDRCGNSFPCQGFADVSLGGIQNTLDYFQPNFFDFPSDSVCLKCNWLKLCKNCYVANFQQTGNLFSTSYEICRFNRIAILAASKIAYYKLIGLNNMDFDDQMRLMAIEMIQNEILDDPF